MTSEIRANIIKNRVGLGTIEYSNTGPIISGVTTALNFKTGTSNLHNTGLNVQDLDVDGHTELDNGNVSGVVTFTNSPNAIQMNDDARVSFGTSLKTSIAYNTSTSRTLIRNYNDTLEIGYRNTEIHHSNVARLSFNTGNTFSNVVNTSFMGANYHAVWIPSSNLFRLNDNAKLAFGSQTDATIHHNNANLLISNTTGNINVTGNVLLNNDISVDGHTNLDNVSISGVSTFSGVVRVPNGSAAAPAIHFGDSDSGLYGDSSNGVRITAGGSDRIVATSNGVTLPIKATALTSFTLGSQSALSKPLYFADAASVESASILLDNSSQELRIKNGRFSGQITFTTYNTEKLRITSAGRVLINSTNTYGSIGGNFHVVNANMGLNTFANNSHAQTFHFTKSRATSGQGGTILQDNDFCGHLEWYADDGVDTASQIAKISGRINGTPGANDTPGELIFYTTADGANASTERLRIEADGRLVLSNSGGIQLSPVASNLYQINGALSYYAANNAVYLNGAGDNGLLRLNATGQYNDRTSINLFGKDVGGYGDTITFRTVSVERARINSNGDLMVGTTSDVSDVIAIFGKNHNGKSAISVENTDTNSSARIRYEFKNGSNTSYIEKYNSGGWYFFNGTPSSSNPNVGFYGSNSWISLRLRPGDRSGNDVAHIAAYWGTSNGLMIEQGGPQSGTFKAIRFTTSHYGGERGYIGVTLGGTSYNSSSDYRMKQDVIDLTGAIDRVKSFKPKRFKWKEDPTYTVDGFLAHEAQTVVPESVQGEKDGKQMQVMDNSKLVPVLTAALKEAIAKIENLETKVAALESS